jgi:hypothetical protein
MKKILVIIIILFFNSAYSQIASSEPDNISHNTKAIKTIANKGAKFKSQPTSYSPFVKRLETDTEVIVKKFVDNHFEICLEDICGYVSEIFLKSNPAMEKMKLDEKDRKIKEFLAENENFIKSITLPGANLKYKPTVNSDISDNLIEETEVVVKSYINNYFEVCYGDKCGYMYEMFLQKSSQLEELKLNSIEKENQRIIVEKESQLKIKNSEENLFIDLSESKSVYKYPYSYSYQLQNFDKKNIKVIGFHNNFYKIKSQDGYFGYVHLYSKEIKSSLDYLLDKQLQERINLHNYDILVRGAAVDNVNSAGGVDIAIDWVYLNNKKDIKYIEFTFSPYNNVSDVQSSEIGGYTRFTGQATGPIKAMKDFTISKWSNAWYNSSITCIKIVKVKVDYMDGSSYVYINEISKILDSNYSNTCK